MDEKDKVPKIEYWKDDKTAQEHYEDGRSYERFMIKKEVEKRITNKENQMKLLSKNFSERDSLGKVWTKKNSAYATVHSELAELSDILRNITQLQSKENSK